MNILKHNLLKSKGDSRVLFFILMDKHIAGYCHINFDEIYEPSSYYYKKLNSKEAYLFKDFIFEKYRGLGLHKFSIYKRLQYLKNTGFNKAYVTIYEDNKYSISSYKHFGFNKIEKWFCFKISGFKFAKNI